MNRVGFLLVFLFSASLVMGQDLIMLHDMRVVYGKVIEVNASIVRYQPDSQGSAEIRTLKREEVVMIHFREGKAGTVRIPPGLGIPSPEDTISGGWKDGLWSMALPGLGDHRVRKQDRPWWVIGAVSYGLIGGGILYKLESNKIYDRYRGSAFEGVDTYRKANNYHHRYLVMTRIGAAIWLGDVVMATIKGYRNDRVRKAALPATEDKVQLFLNEQGELGVRFRF